MEGSDVSTIVVALMGNIKECLSILSIFISSGGLTAILKYKKEVKELEAEVKDIKRLICYRKDCSQRLVDKPCDESLKVKE